MFPANAYDIREATANDAHALRDLAELDSQRRLTLPALMAERRGIAVAAISLSDGRVTADPFQRSTYAIALLRMRAQSLRAVERTPSLRDRMLAGVRVAPATT